MDGYGTVAHLLFDGPNRVCASPNWQVLELSGVLGGLCRESAAWIGFTTNFLMRPGHRN